MSVQVRHLYRLLEQCARKVQRIGTAILGLHVGAEGVVEGRSTGMSVERAVRNCGDRIAHVIALELGTARTVRARVTEVRICLVC